MTKIQRIDCHIYDVEQPAFDFKSLHGNSDEQAAHENSINFLTLLKEIVDPLISRPVASFNLLNAREKVSGCIPNRAATRLLS